MYLKIGATYFTEVIGNNEKTNEVAETFFNSEKEIKIKKALHIEKRNA